MSSGLRGDESTDAGALAWPEEKRRLEAAMEAMTAERDRSRAEAEKAKADKKEAQEKSERAMHEAKTLRAEASNLRAQLASTLSHLQQLDDDQQGAASVLAKAREVAEVGLECLVCSNPTFDYTALSCGHLLCAGCLPSMIREDPVAVTAPEPRRRGRGRGRTKQEPPHPPRRICKCPYCNAEREVVLPKLYLEHFLSPLTEVALLPTT